MEFIKKLYITAFALPMLSSISALQADGTLYFKNTGGSIDLTVVISHQKKAKPFESKGKTHQTRVEIPAHTNNFIKVGYSDEITNVDITSKELGTRKLKDLIRASETINDGGHFDIWGPCNKTICANCVNK